MARPAQQPAKNQRAPVSPAPEGRRPAWKWLLLLSLPFIGYFFAYPQLYAVYHSWQADKALAKQDCELGRYHIEKCLTVWSTSASHHQQAARCCWRDGDLDGARQHLHDASRLGWPAEMVQLEAAFIEAQQSLTPAIESQLAGAYEQVKDNDPESLKPILLEAIAMGHFRSGRPAQAEDAARQLVDRHGSSWRPHFVLGMVHSKKDPDVAAVSFIRSVELKGDEPRTRLWLAAYHAKNGQPHKVLENLAACGKNLPPDAATALLSCRAHFLLGDWKAARADLKRVEGVPHSERDNAAWLTLQGLLELEEKGPDAAAPILAKVESLAPNRLETIEALEALARRRGSADKINFYRERQEQYKDSIKKVQSAQKNLHDLEQAPKTSSDDLAEATYQLGANLFVVGEDEIAARMMHDTLRKQPNLAKAHLALKQYYERIGDNSRARFHEGLAGKNKSVK